MTSERTAGDTGAIRLFLNVPFDQDYASLLCATLFSAVCCGFQPCSALYGIDGWGRNVSRLDRIFKILSSCRYSFHDLARGHGEGTENACRLNIPLELGMAIGIEKPGTIQHTWIAIAPKSFKHELYASDLMGFDPDTYDDSEGEALTKENLVKLVVSTLYTLSQGSAIARPTSTEVSNVLPRFMTRVDELADQWNKQHDINERIPPDWRGIPWPELVRAATDIAKGAEFVS